MHRRKSVHSCSARRVFRMCAGRGLRILFARSRPMYRNLFAKRIVRDYFLEWEKVFNNYYGTPKLQVLNLLKKGKHVLLCIDVKGAEHISQRFPQAIKIFIKPPSMAELRKRLKLRSSETHESLNLRLKVATQELKRAKEYDYIITNANLLKTIHTLETLVLSLLKKR